MKILSFFPFIITAWALLVFAYESYLDRYFIDFVGYLFAAIVLLLYGVRYIKQKRPLHRIIALNIGLLPLLYSNLIVLPLILQGKPINETGMVYVIVLIYGSIFYIVAMLITEVIKMLVEK